MSRIFTVVLTAAAACGGLLATLPAVASNPRSKVHVQFIRSVWEYVQKTDYKSWPRPEKLMSIGVGPALGQSTFMLDKGALSAGSIIISEHDFGDKLGGISVFIKQKDGYSSRNNDWYWVHFTADGSVISASPDKERSRKPGFVSWEVDGRLWVFVMTSQSAADFARSGDLAKSVTRPGAGPGRMTIRSADSETIDLWVATKGGFFVQPDDGRLWVFRSNDAALAGFLAGNEPAKVVIRPGAGPGGATLKALDGETLAAYIAAKDGFATFIVDGRIWVFSLDDPELDVFRSAGEIAKNVTRPGAGPDGMTVRAPDAETLDAYLN